MTKDEFYYQLEQNNIQVTSYQKKQFTIYCNYLLEANQRVNLTGIKDKAGVYLKHFYDSASVTFGHKLKKERVLDIGTGAGFPGVVLKILYPQIELTLIDSNHKKILFLTKLCSKLQLKNVKINCQRVEKLSSQVSYDLIVVRAVASVRILAELGLPLLKINGYLWFLKSHLRDEIETAQVTILKLGGSVPKIQKLPFYPELGLRQVVVVQKTKPTPPGYPRPYHLILKKPIEK